MRMNTYTQAPGLVGHYTNNKRFFDFSVKAKLLSFFASIPFRSIDCKLTLFSFDSDLSVDITTGTENKLPSIAISSTKPFEVELLNSGRWHHMSF